MLTVRIYIQSVSGTKKGKRTKTNMTHQDQENKLINKPIVTKKINLLKPNGYVMHQQFTSQQLYVLPTLYLCVLYLSENKQRLVPLTA